MTSSDFFDPEKPNVGMLILLFFRQRLQSLVLFVPDSQVYAIS